MAKTITITTVDKPVFTATAVAGGSLAASTTYYYKVIAIYTYSGNNYSYSAESPISDEVAVTTNATNKKVDIVVTPPANASKYILLRTTTSGDYAWSANHCVIYSGTTLYPFPTASFSDDGTKSLGRFHYYENGMPSIRPEGGSSVDPITPDYIYDEMVSAGVGAWAYKHANVRGDTDYYHFHCGFESGLDINNPSYMIFPAGKTYHFEGYFRTASYCTFLMGTERLSGVFGTSGSTLVFSGRNIAASGNQIGGIFQFFDSKIFDFTEYYTDGESIYGLYRAASRLGGFSGDSATTPSKLYNCTLHCTGSNPQMQGNIDAKNSFLEFNPRFESSAYNYASPVFTNCNIDGNNFYTFVLPYAKMAGCKILRSSVNELFFHGGSAGIIRVFTFLDMDFYNNPVKSSQQTTPELLKYMVKFTLDITVLDEKGNPIEGANVIIKNKNGYIDTWTDTGTTMSSTAMSQTQVAFAPVDATKIAIGDTLMIRDERMLVTANSGGLVTVQRKIEDTLDARYQNPTGAISKRVLSLTTDANGKMPDNEVMVSDYVYNAAGATNYKYTKTDYTPHTITVQKDGYETYTTTLSINNTTRHITIKLRQGTPGRDSMGEEWR